MSYRELGLNIDGLKNSIRPYTERAEKRRIIEAGQFVGDFEAFLKMKGSAYQEEFLGPNRFKLWKEKKISVKDLTDKEGNVRLLKKDKDGKAIGLQK